MEGNSMKKTLAIVLVLAVMFSLNIGGFHVHEHAHAEDGWYCPDCGSWARGSECWNCGFTLPKFYKHYSTIKKHFFSATKIQQIFETYQKKRNLFHTRMHFTASSKNFTFELSFWNVCTAMHPSLHPVGFSFALIGCHPHVRLMMVLALD